MDRSEAAKILNVGKEATAEEVNKAFKHRSKYHHPDKEGGSHDAFVRLQLAHDVLLGKDQPKPENSQAIAEFMSAFQSILIKANDPLKVDLIGKTKMKLAELKVRVAGSLEAMEAELDVTRGILLRMECTSKEDFIKGMLTKHLTDTERGLAEAKIKILNIEAAMDIADTYKYNADRPETNLAGGIWGNPAFNVRYSL